MVYKRFEKQRTYEERLKALHLFSPGKEHAMEIDHNVFQYGNVLIKRMVISFLFFFSMLKEDRTRSKQLICSKG